MEPLSLNLISDVPTWLRLIPPIFNHKCESRFRIVLISRDPHEVTELWASLGVPNVLLHAVCEIIRDNMKWCSSLFIPEDQCTVLFKLWRAGFADCMEREQFLIELERLIGGPLPQELKIHTSFGELMRQVAQCRP